MQALSARLNEPVDAASLAFFRIVFGCIMLYSQLRFLIKGWVHFFYVKPHFFFKYYGFYWVRLLPGAWIYLPWLLMILCLVMIIVGKYYRWAMTAFFLLFSYTELLDLTNYLNHYYLITLLSFLMIFLPMNAVFSLDAKRSGGRSQVPRWTLTVLRLQVGLVYFFAGVAKIKPDWLIHAEPMKIWLGTCGNIPVIGRLLATNFTAYLFSWAGMLFDLTATFFLLNKRTRPYEYLLIIVFHSLTMWLFYIGIFPLVMMGAALIFFSPSVHRRALEKCLPFLDVRETGRVGQSVMRYGKGYAIFFVTYFCWQFLMPLRYLLYPGNVLWTEQGFRYAWNVMLMEKDGYAEFEVKDKVTNQHYLEYPKKNLTPLQEKMMTTQPDMILQYAHFLARQYEQRLHHPMAVYVYSYVSLNQREGQLYIDPDTDLSAEKDSFLPKRWILPEKK